MYYDLSHNIRVAYILYLNGKVHALYWIQMFSVRYKAYD